MTSLLRLVPPLLALIAAVLLLITWGERAISSPGISHFYNPMWACGDAPPFLVVDISVNREQYRGTAMRLFRHGADLHADGQPGAAPHSFLACEGRLKKSLALFLQERWLMEGTAASAGGIFFDATNCFPATPTLEQQAFIDRMLYDEESLVP